MKDIDVGKQRSLKIIFDIDFGNGMNTEVRHLEALFCIHCLVIGEFRSEKVNTFSLHPKTKKDNNVKSGNML